MSILRRGAAGALVTSALIFGSASQAFAAPVGCGSVITATMTLTVDIGGCNQGGLLIGADNITLDLGGHTVGGRSRTGDGIGISTNGHSGVVIKNGIVRDFDTGVAIAGGGGSTVDRVTARDNIGPAKINSKFGLGEGIVINGSSDNTVSNNTVLHNGPFGGITILADTGGLTKSSGNDIVGNMVVANDVPHDGVNEDDGIRIEGPNSPDNSVIGNTVRQSGLDGIALFADQLTGFKNTGTIVANNVVEGNGFHDKGHRKGDGIVLFGSPTNPAVGGADATSVHDNTVRGNAASGIRVASKSNTITSNVATGNAAFPGQTTAFDLRDQNAACDNNTWLGNVFGTASSACIG